MAAWLRSASNRSIISYANRESHIWCRLFLGGGRNFPQFEGRLIHSGRVCRWDKGEPDIQGCLHGQDRARRGGGSGIRSVARQLRRATGCFLVEPQSHYFEPAGSRCWDAISLGDFLSSALFAKARPVTLRDLMLIVFCSLHDSASPLVKGRGLR